MVKITKDGDKILREVAEPLNIDAIRSRETQKILKDMSEALNSEKFGVAIAAPQIGVPLRIFVVAGKIFNKKDNTQKADGIFINPIILKRSKKMQESHESCLSIQGRPPEQGPDVAGVVLRPEKMKISYYNEKGEKKEYGASGFLSAIFDHEIDHLNGTLFIDKTINVWEIDKDFNKVS